MPAQENSVSKPALPERSAEAAAKRAPPAEPNLDEMIAQMVMVGFRGLAIDERNPVVRDIRERKIGGVFLFERDLLLLPPVRNVQSPQQLKALTASLQALAQTPLLIGIDQEGGMVNRLKEKYGFPPFPSAQSLGSHGDLSATRAAATLTAQTLARAGVNLNLAPDVDVNLNPDNPVIGKLERSFSANPAVVSAHAAAWIEAHHAQGVLTTLKHFPGHGSSRDDSHLGLVDVTQTWSRQELEPFARLIAAGQADVVMTAHIYDARLDPQRPATLSRNIIGGILRGELGYNGVVMSDDMQMRAISQYYGFDSAIEAALGAGVDILAFANNLDFDPEVAARAIATVKSLLLSGRISVERITESYQRITTLKQRLKIV